MIVSGMSGNELFCLHEKGFGASELVVGNSVVSIGVVGGIGAAFTGVTGGEITPITNMISEGRHAAIERMRHEAEKHGAVGVTAVTSELRTLSGYMEFLAQGTAITGPSAGTEAFTTAASGMTLYCHLDAGYRPVKFAMGNVAYALGVGQGFVGSMRTMARGEVKEFSQMYNHIRHLALDRLRAEAKAAGANAVVDVTVQMLPFGNGTTELLMTGTASHHNGLPEPASAHDVVTSELTGEELWNLAQMGYVPVQLVMATSVYSLGVVGGIGAMFKGITKGEIPELTKIVYEARENCVKLLRIEAEKCGAERVIGNKLMIRELSPGLIEIMSVGTAIRKMPGMTPKSAVLIPQAIIVDRDNLESSRLIQGGTIGMAAASGEATPRRQNPILGCVILLVMGGFFILVAVINVLANVFTH